MVKKVFASGSGIFGWVHGVSLVSYVNDALQLELWLHDWSLQFSAYLSGYSLIPVTLDILINFIVISAQLKHSITEYMGTGLFQKVYRRSLQTTPGTVADQGTAKPNAEDGLCLPNT